jgi:hypothetical protein
MKVYYLVESDTDYASLFAWQLERIWAPELLAHVFRKPEGGHNFAEMNPAQFFGNLNSLLRTRITPGAPKINLAEPNLSAPELPSPPPVEVPPSGIDAEEAALADAARRRKTTKASREIRSTSREEYKDGLLRGPRDNRGEVAD